MPKQKIEWLYIGGKLTTPNFKGVIEPDDIKKLRKARITYAKIRECTPDELHKLTEISFAKCEKLVALSLFQTLHGVSVKAALDLWELGCRDLKDVSKRDPNEMYREMVKRYPPQDPCVEDTFFGAVGQSIAVVDYHTLIPNEKAQWWHWMSLRGKDSKAVQEKVKELITQPSNPINKKNKHSQLFYKQRQKEFKLETPIEKKKRLKK